MIDLKGQAAIVTGSATGVGAAVARALAADGCNVVVNYTRSEKEAQETAQACRDLGVEAITVQANVAEDADCRKLVDAALDKWGKLNHVVNNAGTTKFADQNDLSALTAEDFQKIYAVNVIGPYQMAKWAEPHLRAAGKASITNVSSIAGVTGIGSCMAYAASKGALNTMTMSLARSLGPEIRVNTICPGMIQSRWLENGMGKEKYDQLLANQQRTLPLQRVSTPEDNAEIILWLIKGSELVTGEFVMVDGGAHLGFSLAMAR